MSVIDRVDGTTPPTVSDLPATVADVSEPDQQSTPRPIRELVDDRLLDELLARSRDQAGGLRLTGEGSMLAGRAGVRRPRTWCAATPTPSRPTCCGSGA
jgi:hypothetical protein